MFSVKRYFAFKKLKKNRIKLIYYKLFKLKYLFATILQYCNYIIHLYSKEKPTKYKLNYLE